MMTSCKQFSMVALVCLAAALSSTSAPAATFSSNPVADAFVTTGATNNFSSSNFGATGILGVAAPGKAQGEFQSVMQFNLAGALSAFDTQFGAGQWTLQSITLQLTAAPNNNAILNIPSAGQFSISWMQNDSWVEGTGTANVPTMDGITFDSLQNTFIGGGDQALGTFAYGGATSGSNTYTLTLSSGLTADLLAGGLTSFRILSADSNVSYLFNSRSISTAASRPLLTVTAVPEPSALALGALGVSLLVGWKRRSR